MPEQAGLDCCPESGIGAEVTAAGEDAVAVSLSGEIDMDNAGHLIHLLSGLLDGRPRLLTVDMGGVTFLSSAGIKALSVCFAEAQDAGGRLWLTHLTPLVSQVLTIAELRDLLTEPPG